MFDYYVVRSRRKSYLIKITAQNRVEIRAPLGSSDRDIAELIERKKSWIEKSLCENCANELMTEGVLSYKEAYVFGKLMPVLLSNKNYIDENGVHVSGLKGFARAYTNSLYDSFERLFYQTQEQTGLVSQGFSFRAYKSMWGCCNRADKITFNFKLLMLPVELQHYVIVHELCHTRRRDHSAYFWRLCEKFVPDCKKLRAEMKKYAFLARMY